ncbi:DUF1534 domain-containing protein [Pseudomonas syringae]|nr:DUF1534 domain-containing protein [Pseudomonas syringae]
MLSHLSFLTLQHGNAVRDALRHTSTRHRSLQSPQKRRRIPATVCQFFPSYGGKPPPVLSDPGYRYQCAPYTAGF